MSWQDQVQAAAYTSPSGERLEFAYTDVEILLQKKTTAFEFPDADGTFVQDLGRTGSRIPLRVFISGDDYLASAAKFYSMLGETGHGRLEHPLYGVFDVVPFGDIRRRDNLVTRANQAVFDVVFFETNRAIFPTEASSPANEVRDATKGFETAAADTFADEVSIDTAVEKSSLVDAYQAFTQEVKQALDGVAAVEATIERQFENVFNSINDNIQTFVGDPLSLAFQTNILVGLPSRAGALIGATLVAYNDLLTQITSQAPFVPSNDSEPANDFRTAQLHAGNYISASVQSVLDNTFEIKADAIRAAESLLDSLDDYGTWLDANLTSLGLIDTGESYQQLQKAAALAAGFLVEISFSLKQERSIVTDRARTPIDLEAELYGTVGSNLDFLITSNAFHGTEIMEVPAGRTVVFYT